MLVAIGLLGPCSMYLVACILFTLLVCSLMIMSSDAVGNLLITSSRQLLVYLCNKLITVVAIDFVYCSYC